MSAPFLIVGLGNPGVKYAANRHNIGFMAVDTIAAQYAFPPFVQRLRGMVSDGNIGVHKVLLFKPLSFMNLSGQPVGGLARFYKIPVQQVVAIHDELDLALSKLRVKHGGGHGGHNGLKSLDAHIGQEYWRVRLGIGHPGIKELVSPYVLSDFMKAEQPAVEALLGAVSKELPLLLAGDAAGFMSKVALRLPSSVI